MQGDFTRWTYAPAKNYSAVLLQQGRVLLDADWNEAREIELARERALATDLIGRAAGPLHGAGFAVVAIDTDADGNADALQLRSGRYYVDGILCELHEDTLLSSQPDLPGFDPTAALPLGRYAVYLDVWERHVTSIEDAEIKEKALGGPDHTTRAQVVTQARLLPLADLEADECELLHDPAALAALIEGTRGRMAASVDPAPPSIDPCLVPATAGFRGLENQLYRVEIHRAGNDGNVTIKWSRDNASVVTTWDGHPDPAGEPEVIVVADFGPDQERGLQASGLLVELHDDIHQLAPGPGLLARIDQADEASRTLTLKEPMDAAGNILSLAAIRRGADAHHPRVRRWDGAGLRRIDEVDQNDGGFGWIRLENGVRVRFDFGGGQTFRSGDYWLIPARTVDGSIRWNPDELQLPHGAAHHYACLAIVEHVSAGRFSVERSCQTFFPSADSLVQLQYAGGDGQQAVLGRALPAPLRVQVLNGGVPREGAKVSFRLVEPPLSDGSLTDMSAGGSAKVLIVNTDADGIGQVTWTLPSEAARLVTPALIDQRVEAILLDACGAETGQTIVFNTHESQAREVRYDNAAAPMALLHAAGHETDNVQRALDVLSGNPQLSYTGGDGQEALPGDELPNELVVRVGNGAFPMKAIIVAFTLVELATGDDADAESWAGSLTPPAGATVSETWPSGRPRVITVSTNGEGLAWVRWRLGNIPSNHRPGVVARIALPTPYDTFNPGAAIRFAAQMRDGAGSTCGEIVLRPDGDLAAIVASIPPGADAHLCVHPGLFSLRQTLEVRGKGHLIITGAGPASRFHGEKLEQVLRFVDCEAVHIRDVAVEADGAGNVGDGLLGALTFLDCGEVDVDHVTVRSNGAGTRRMSGVEARIVEGRRADSTVRIQRCDIEVGHGQTGILVIDAAEADVQNNRVSCPEAPWSLRDAMADDLVAAWVGRRILSRVRILREQGNLNSNLFVGSSLVALSEDFEDPRLTKEPGRVIMAGSVEQWPVASRWILTFTVHPMFADANQWSDLLQANPMPGWNSGLSPTEKTFSWIEANLRRLRKNVAKAAFGLTSPVTLPSDEVKRLLSVLTDQIARENGLSAGGQGIVIAGMRTPWVGSAVTQSSWNTVFTSAPRTPSARVTGNTVTGFVQGIHIGTSDNNSMWRVRRLRTYRARVTDNVVHLRVPPLSRERHGIFVGNAHNVQVCDNLIELVFPDMAHWEGMPPLDGIRLWGTYGPMLQVTGNHCAGVSTGVRIQVLNRDQRSYPHLSWRAANNSYAGFGVADDIAML